MLDFKEIGEDAVPTLEGFFWETISLLVRLPSFGFGLHWVIFCRLQIFVGIIMLEIVQDILELTVDLFDQFIFSVVELLL